MSSSDRSAGSSGASLRVALLQVASSRDPAVNLARLNGLCEEFPTETDAADVVVLPEAFACDFGPAGSSVADAAEELDGPFVAALTEAAKKQGGTWVAGMFERSEDPQRPYNTLVVVDGGGLRATYRKIHLYDSFGYKESDRLSRGDRTAVTVEVGGLTIGLMTCYDLRFPELARDLSRAGADVMVVPAAWVAGPRKVRHWETLLTARAIENVSYVVGVGQPGPRYSGHSAIVDPRGDVVVTSTTGEGAATGTICQMEVTAARLENPSLENRRDDN